jgi:hypothetical protein
LKDHNLAVAHERGERGEPETHTFDRILKCFQHGIFNQLVIKYPFVDLRELSVCALLGSVATSFTEGERMDGGIANKLSGGMNVTDESTKRTIPCKGQCKYFSCRRNQNQLTKRDVLLTRLLNFHRFGCLASPGLIYMCFVQHGESVMSVDWWQRDAQVDKSWRP